MANNINPSTKSSNTKAGRVTNIKAKSGVCVKRDSETGRFTSVRSCARPPSVPKTPGETKPKK